MVHQDTVYSKHALWDSVAAWFAGGPPSTGAIDLAGVHVRTFNRPGYATWEIASRNADGSERMIPLDWSAFATASAFDSQTYGYRWNAAAATPNGRLVTLPEYFHLENPQDKKTARWVPVAAVPPETGLRQLNWMRPVEPKQQAYDTPNDPASSWKRPGPAAGPFRAHLGDGTVVTYYWYRFADQPALMNAGLTTEERERMQARVVKIHRAWPKSRNYLPPPKSGKLADIDPALIVKPPKGLEVGYVPIATRQEMKGR